LIQVTVVAGGRLADVVLAAVGRAVVVNLTTFVCGATLTVGFTAAVFARFTAVCSLVTAGGGNARQRVVNRLTDQARAISADQTVLAVDTRIAVTTTVLVAFGTVLEFVVTQTSSAHQDVIVVGSALAAFAVVVGLALFSGNAVGAITAAVQVRFIAIDGVVTAARVGTRAFPAEAACTVPVVAALLAVDAIRTVVTTAVSVAFRAVPGLVFASCLLAEAVVADVALAVGILFTVLTVFARITATTAIYVRFTLVAHLVAAAGR
jgi:hypothetical protein